MSRMSKQERDILVYNLKNMMNHLRCTYMDINNKYDTFPIPHSTICRWMTKDIQPNKDWSWEKDFLQFYNSYFEPEIDECKSFYKIRINMHIKEAHNVDDLFRYQGVYYIYYYSSHYESVIHSGKLLIQRIADTTNIRLVLGIQDSSQLQNESFCDIFDKGINNEEANIRFQNYKNSQPTDLRQRCYFYEGKIHIENYKLWIEFTGKDNRKNHKQTLFLNIKKKPKSISKSYKGGLGLVIASPNEFHNDFRIYKMGLSRQELKTEDLHKSNLLKMEINPFNRISLNIENDQMWYDKILLYEQKSFEKD